MNRARGLAVLLVTLGGCANHYLVHPHRPAPQIVTWADDFQRGPLLIHVEGARPPGAGPFPTGLVHAEGGKAAVHLRGVIWDLAARGYLALAADYRRWIDGDFRASLFTWRSADDVTAILDVARAYPEIDQDRIGALGFSQGGVYSLLIAAHAPERIKAVVSYYPVTDFPRWFALDGASPLRRFAFLFVRRYFRGQSGASSDADFDRMIGEASPYRVADRIRAPVLLVHGASDTTAPVDQSQRMAERLAADGKIVKLLVVPGGKHIFNFRDRAQAAVAWDATLEWLDRYLRREDAIGGSKRSLPSASMKIGFE